MKKVSVVIPVYNEADVIAACLKSLGEQTYEDFEIILVDDGSTDDSVRIVRNSKFHPRSGRSFPNSKLFRQKHKGPGAARNLGAKKAGGDILVFVDADMTFDKDFIGNLAKPINQGKSKGTFSKEEYVLNWENVWARYWNINQNWPAKKRHPEDYPNEDKVFRAILKSEFDRVGGFTPGGYTDDYSLSEKLGYKSEVAPNARFYHKNPAGLPEVFLQAKWVGKRPYKLGYIGYLVGLIRASLPVSLAFGLAKSITKLQPAFLVFKVVYDLGIFIGILEYIFVKKGTK